MRFFIGLALGLLASSAIGQTWTTIGGNWTTTTGIGVQGTPVMGQVVATVPSVRVDGSMGVLTTNSAGSLIVHIDQTQWAELLDAIRNDGRPPRW